MEQAAIGVHYVAPACSVACVLGNSKTISDRSGAGSGEHGRPSECLHITGTDRLLCEMLCQGPEEWLVPVTSHCSNDPL